MSCMTTSSCGHHLAAEALEGWATSGGPRSGSHAKPAGRMISALAKPFRYRLLRARIIHETLSRADSARRC